MPERKNETKINNELINIAESIGEFIQSLIQSKLKTFNLID